MTFRLLTTACHLQAAALSLAASLPRNDLPLPLVIWNGLGHDLNNAVLPPVGDMASDIHPGTFVYNIMNNIVDDDWYSVYLGNISSQLDKVCNELAKHPVLSLAPAIDAIGFSQGGLFLRAYVERCNKPPVRSLVTFGSQHNGIARLPDCAPTNWPCKSAMTLLRFNNWSSFVQSRVVPAQYLRDLGDYASYLDGSNFLADINNERERKNSVYASRLASLAKFVMFMFEQDSRVIPRESSWFGDKTPNSNVPLRQRRLYLEDWLGLRELDDKGAIVFRAIAAEHMHIPWQALNDTIREFFGPYQRRFRSHKYQDPVTYGAFGADEL
ncbi:hypothetical protein LMH87_001433 [Akanthomyces muscarius]|uniref:Palmitoyl-protein thioesterase 1 n=1 Tax=Akanthomyces muscarius TaxID=2231603 RepID=A0A9W8UIE4_AKAMU|nr:hypothetical protein LMH87_001433 [Akanthomyces muscarius]KAJ4146874.1 hypothetical protein LMH87_001433 [Akanthomyces muscarius]